MVKRKTVEAMGAAECARRTGLTVRALRVYEKHGLIEPARAANGWRCYGPRELLRLNAIVTLKSLGLSLGQIKGALTGATPAIAAILRMQVRALQVRQGATEKALLGIRAALARLDAQQILSIDELCNLLRSIELTQPQAQQQRMRRLIDEYITPEEELAWVNYHRDLPREELERGARFAAEYRQVFLDLAALARTGADPEGPEAQRLVDVHNRVLTQSRMREKAIAALEWNPQLAGKWLELGAHYYADPEDSNPAAAHRVSDFIMRAIKSSPASRALDSLRDRAGSLMESDEPPCSHAAQALAAELRAIADAYKLGDPLVVIKWAIIRGKKRVGNAWTDLGDHERSAWEYLGRALTQTREAAA